MHRPAPPRPTRNATPHAAPRRDCSRPGRTPWRSRCAIAAPARWWSPPPTWPPCLAALAQAGCGGLSVLPLWPKPGRPAKLVLLRGIKNGRGGSRILPGLVLHGDDGGFTPQAQAILRDGAPLDF